MHGAMGTVSEDALSELIDQSLVRDDIIVPFLCVLYLCAKHQGILLDLLLRFLYSLFYRTGSLFQRAN